MCILMCDETLSVLFKDGNCINYLGSNQTHYNAMVGAPSKGHWLPRNLYRILPYQRIRLPCPPAGCACCTQGIPRTVHATLGDTVQNCISGTIALTFNRTTQKWSGTGPIGTCGHNVTLDFYCAAGGTDCTGLRLDITYPDGCAPNFTGGQPLPGCSCSPLNIIYVFRNVGDCANQTQQSPRVTITT